MIKWLKNWLGRLFGCDRVGIQGRNACVGDTVIPCQQDMINIILGGSAIAHMTKFGGNTCMTLSVRAWLEYFRINSDGFTYTDFKNSIDNVKACSMDPSYPDAWMPVVAAITQWGPDLGIIENFTGNPFPDDWSQVSGFNDAFTTVFLPAFSGALQPLYPGLPNVEKLFSQLANSGYTFMPLVQFCGEETGFFTIFTYDQVNQAFGAFFNEAKQPSGIF